MASASAPTATRDAITRAFQQQRAGARREPAPSLEARLDRLRRLGEALRARRTDLQDALYADSRKPPEETDMTEVYPVAADIDHAAAHLEDWMQPQPVSTPAALVGTTSAIHYQPKGVVLIIAPWNYPVNLTLSPLVSALAAGNRAVLKPSELAPHTAAVLRALIGEAFAPHEVTLFEGDKEVAQALLDRPFDHFFFTGSAKVGTLVMKAAAEHLASVTLELGGKSPAVVDATADVDDAARKIAWTKFVNAGQTCIAPDYVLAHESVHAELVYALGRRIRRFYGLTEEERRASFDFARMIDDRHFERVRMLLGEAVEAGARAAIGGETEAAERYVAPTVLTDVPPESRLMREEIFGPVLPVLPFGTLGEALTAVNERPNPLALYVFSRDEAAVVAVLARPAAGGTCVNDAMLHTANPALPFGGAGRSGIGRYHGVHGFRTFSHERAVLRRKHGSSVLELLFPPYGGAARRLVGALRRWL